ncbi:hypothetical protein GOV06_02740 [Candidatus Woesearchaeota archaeon]|nr:hypothetical protein [Candidatus Woesearchaeota archaeon]
MEIKFDVVKPNVYCIDANDQFWVDSVYFSCKSQDVVDIGRKVDRIVKEHAGELKVKPGDMKVLIDGEGKSKKEYTEPLSAYLDLLENYPGATDEERELAERIARRFGLGDACNREVTNSAARLLRVGYIIDAANIEDLEDSPSPLRLYRTLKRVLENPEENFSRVEECEALVIDRKETLAKMHEKLHELKSTLPDIYSGFHVINGESPITQSCVGTVCLGKINAPDNPGIDKAKSELVEMLQEFDGPCLSYDAPSLLIQADNLFEDSVRLVENYGDVLLNPKWRKRLFMLDP